jgi:hypothetical protein
MGQKRRSQHVRNESAYPPIAAGEQTSRLIGSVPKPVITPAAEGAGITPKLCAFLLWGRQRGRGGADVNCREDQGVEHDGDDRPSQCGNHLGRDRNGGSRRDVPMTRPRREVDAVRWYHPSRWTIDQSPQSSVSHRAGHAIIFAPCSNSGRAMSWSRRKRQSGFLADGIGLPSRASSTEGEVALPTSDGPQSSSYLRPSRA